MSDHTEVATCQREGCKSPLTGKQEKWCSETCKVRAWYEAQVSGRTAEDLLAALPQKELRAVIRRVMERRHPEKYDRLRVRFGEPGQPPLHEGRYQG